MPIKPPKKPRPLRFGRAVWIAGDQDGPGSHVWLVRRPDKGILGGMRALPGGDWGMLCESAPNGERDGARTYGPVRHIFTHFALDLVVDVHDDVSLAVGEGEWWPVARLDEAGLPTLYRRAAALALGE